eukprot:SAG31_NODE_975_length_10623_cov_7.244964_14_plen_147_part_00
MSQLPVGHTVVMNMRPIVQICDCCDMQTDQKPTDKVVEMLRPETAGICCTRMLELVPPNRREQDAMEAQDTPPLLTLDEVQVITDELAKSTCPLEALDVSFNRLSTAHIELLSQGLRNALKLRTLDVRFNGFGNEGVRHMAATLVR